MSFSLRFATMLLALSVPVALVPGLSTRVMAQTTEPQPLLQVEGTLQSDDDTLDNGSFYDAYEFDGQADQTVTILLESEAFDAYLILENEEGDRIATNDDMSLINTNAALVITLPTSGRYRVIANTYQGGTQGPYRLAIYPSPVELPNPLLSNAEVTLLEANQLFQTGLSRFNRSEFRVALALWEEALVLFRLEDMRTTFPQNSVQGEAASLGNLGNAYYSLGDYERAIDFHQQSLVIDRELRNRLGEANSLGNLGVVYRDLGDYERAIDFQQQALVIARELGNRLGEAQSLGNLGIAYDDLGDYERAIDFHQQSLVINREIGNRHGEADSLGNLGNAYYSLGDYERAINFQQQALVIDREMGNRLGEANSLVNLGNVYRDLGDYERDIDFQQQALDIAREIGYRLGESQSLGNLGIAYSSLGDYESAIDFQQQSLDIAREIGNRLGEANSLLNLGNAYYSLSDYERAISLQQQALIIAREIGNRSGEAQSLGSLGNIYYLLGDNELAINFLQQALVIAREIGNRSGESTYLHNLGVAFWYLENLAEAESHFQDSTYVLESLHLSGLDDTSRLSLLDSQQITYHLWQRTLIAQGQPEKALVIAEHSRAQSLAVSMARSLASNVDKFTYPTPPNLEQIQTIATQQNATLVEYSVLSSGRILIWIIQPNGTIYSTENDAAALDDSLLGPAGVLASLSPNGRGGESPKTPLSSLVQDTQAALTRGDSSGAQSQIARRELDTHLQELHKVLIEPIAQWLPDDDQQRVIFIPHQELFRVPFAALQDDDGTYLIQKHTILTAPSIQSLDLARQHRTRIQATNATNALIVGNPTFPQTLADAYGWKALPGAEREARNVGNYLSQYLGKPLDILFHNQATETLVKERLHSARFIHFATHGTLASSNEPVDLPALQYSTIPGVLALAASDQDDGSLTADELFDMTINNPLNAELVVLSACQTGQGPITSDGVYGLSRTLLTAGVPTLVVSLWNASDHHTVGLMDEFYRQFLEEGQDKAQALRQAMLQMIEQGDDNPQYWAAFTLIGEAEQVVMIELASGRTKHTSIDYMQDLR
ncbi:MAG: tetratricopeptide repeat protein [Cyanobacteria bacterium P01_F01_bin.150]